MNSLALLRGSLWSDLSRGTRVGLRLRWLCFSLSSYSSGIIRWWDGTVDRKVKNQIISWQDLKNINFIIGKRTVTLDALDFVLQEIAEYFGKHLLVSFWEWDEKTARLARPNVKKYSCCPASVWVYSLTFSSSTSLFASLLSPPLPILELPLLFLLFAQLSVPFALALQLFQPVPVVQKKPRRIQSRSVQTTKTPTRPVFGYF